MLLVNLRNWRIPMTTLSRLSRPVPAIRESVAVQVRSKTAECFSIYDNDPALRPGKPQLIRAGKHGGLPFDSLTSDLIVGCLPAREICYGNCFAARAAFSSGTDFGKRVPNVLDRDTLVEDLDRLPQQQRFLRCGWNSDPSWDWQAALKLAQWIHETGRITIFVTKSFTRVPFALLADFASVRAELRVSVSAFDTDAQLEHRLCLLTSYQAAGGVAVPLMMTAYFNNSDLMERQEKLVHHLLELDLPTAENSLRFDSASPMLSLLDISQMRPVLSSNDLWSGRLFPQLLRVPTTTSIPSTYEGLQSGSLSRNSSHFLKALFCDPVHTHEEVLAGPLLDKPMQCGVALGAQPGCSDIPENAQ
jgi:hypothetical protein